MEDLSGRVGEATGRSCVRVVSKEKHAAGGMV